jgi:uncharacterized protein YegP (UPF0339 family)
MSSKSVVICFMFLSVLFISEINSKLAKNKKLLLSSWDGVWRLKAENKEVLLWEDYYDCKTACNNSCYSTHSYVDYKFLVPNGKDYWICFEKNAYGWANRYSLNDNDRQRVYENNHFTEEDRKLNWSHLDYCDAYCLATQQELCKSLVEYDMYVNPYTWPLCKFQPFKTNNKYKTNYPIKIINKKK